MRIASKKPGVTLRHPACTSPLGGASAARSCGVTLLLNPNWRKGLVDVAPAAATPGSARTRASTSRIERDDAVFRIPRRGSSIGIAMVASASNPGSTRVSRMKLFASSPAPTSSISASADFGDDERMPHAAAAGRIPQPFVHAGAKVEPRGMQRRREAEERQLAMPATQANASTPASICSPSSRGMRPAPSTPTASTAHDAMITPAPVPSSASTADSVNSCRTSRPRPAPSAARTRISPRRFAAWATSRFATFAHASSSSRPTAPKSTHTASRTRGATIHSAKGTASALHPAFDSGCASDSRRAISRSSPRACGRVAPGASRPITASSLSPRSRRGSAARGTHASAPPGKSNRGGITPVTTNGRPSSVTVRPTICGSAPKRRRQRPSPRTTRRSDERGRSSSAMNMRPSAGRTPSTSAADAAIGTAAMRSDSPPPLSTIEVPSSR